MIADGRDTDSIPIYTTMIPQQSLTKKTLFGVHTQVSYIYIYIYIYVCCGYMYVYAYSGGRLLPFMQEGVAFARATLGAHVLIIGSQ